MIPNDKKSNPPPDTKIVELTGGMGNQMFQYVFGQKLNQMTKCKVLYDNTWFDLIKDYKTENNKIPPLGISLREYQLGIFNLDINFATKEEINEAKELKKSRLRGFFRKIFNIPKDKSFIVYEKTPFDYDKELFTFDKKYYIGYFQNPKYLEGIENKIRKYFTFPKIEDEYNLNILNKIKACKNPVFIHIRRGDYLNLGWTLSMDYYRKAIEYTVSKLQDPVFFVFDSECEDFIEKEFKIDYPFEYIGNQNSLNNEDWKDMYLMTQFKHGIIANSTFSWWGAMLGEGKDRIITAPDPFVDGSSTIIPNNWEKISWQKN